MRWIGQNQTPWRPVSVTFGTVATDIRKVAAGILLEILLPIGLLLLLVLLTATAATLLLDAKQLTDLVSRAADFIDNLSQGFNIRPAELAGDAWKLLTGLQANVAPAVEKGASIVVGAASAALSLLIFLFRRRQASLNVTGVVAAEITTIVALSLQVMPITFARRDFYLDLARGVQLLGASSDRQLMLLDPGTGLAARLPTCMLDQAVAFFHADLALHQLYNGMLLMSFAKADRARRAGHIDQFEAFWKDNYEPVAFSLIFRLALYKRLRVWSI